MLRFSGSPSIQPQAIGNHVPGPGDLQILFHTHIVTMQKRIKRPQSNEGDRIKAPRSSKGSTQSLHPKFSFELTRLLYNTVS